MGGEERFLFPILTGNGICEVFNPHKKKGGKYEG